MDGDNTQPPLDKDGRPITSISNPKLRSLVLQCHNHQNWNSCVPTGKKCRFGCKYDGKQYPLGKCPVCVSACSYAWDRNNHAELCQYFELKRLQKESSPSEKELLQNIWTAFISLATQQGRRLPKICIT